MKIALVAVLGIFVLGGSYVGYSLKVCWGGVGYRENSLAYWVCAPKFIRQAPRGSQSGGILGQPEFYSRGLDGTKPGIDSVTYRSFLKPEALVETLNTYVIGRGYVPEPTLTPGARVYRKEEMLARLIVRATDTGATEVILAEELH